MLSECVHQNAVDTDDGEGEDDRDHILGYRHAHRVPGRSGRDVHVRDERTQRLTDDTFCKTGENIYQVITWF